jgi:sterol desaturase/sphingolipid hydroxylase (fatty acid hydroxylase superfamily)
LVFEGILYAWHRALHSVNPLWRSFHQMHHSAERLDAFGAFWFSPLDMMGFTLVGSVALVLFVGINTDATTGILLSTFFLAIFQHGNFKTPRWLGYVVQRPESHSYHHAKGIHKHNYADLPLFDIVFGTFVNPPKHLENGFYQGASYRVVDMVLWRDISQETVNDPNLPLEEAV